LHSKSGYSSGKNTPRQDRHGNNFSFKDLIKIQGERIQSKNSLDELSSTEGRMQAKQFIAKSEPRSILKKLPKING